MLIHHVALLSFHFSFCMHVYSYTSQALASLYGHEDWVSCLTSARLSDGNIMMISGSQDCKIRLWRVSEIASASDVINTIDNDNATMLNDGDGADDDDDDDDDEGDAEKNAPVEEEESNLDARIKFAVTNGSSSSSSSSDRAYAVYMEAICVGHEDWVTSVQWVETDTEEDLCFISTSMDRNIIIWYACYAHVISNKLYLIISFFMQCC